MNKKKVSIVVPVYNEIRNIEKLIIRIADAMEGAEMPYEIVFVDDHSVDGTYEYLQRYRKSRNVTVLQKKGKKGKAYSLLEGFAVTTGDVIVMIDADLQYPPEAVVDMVKKLSDADIVVAHRKDYKGSSLRRFLSKSFRHVFGGMLFGLHADIQSGLKVFTREVLRTIPLAPRSGWTFDLEFLYKSAHAGFKIAEYPITFYPRSGGKSNVKLLRTVVEIGGNALLLRMHTFQPMRIPPQDGKSMVGAGVGYKKKKYVTHTTLSHHVSAMQTFILRQKIFFFALFGLIAYGLITNALTTGIIIVAILSTVYFIDVLFNLYIILKSLSSPQEIMVSKAEIGELNDADLPVYTILCPLYREAHVIPGFLKAIDKIDWPKNKLDVILLLEEDDPQAKFVVEANSPSYVRAVIVPNSMPKTKPKACNYGLSIARGEYLVIYDAEDIPDVDQLKKAYVTFQNVPKNIVCLQAKLNYYNPHHNLLTRFFTAEYSLWFDVTLPGFQALDTSIPLGGTSNHFRTKDLQKLEGWDPFNVTEDADLGVRLFKQGYKTAMIDSTTLEEANSSLPNWIRQRSRWIKGYMQTYLVHMRSVRSFVKEHKYHALYFQLAVGGKLAFILINPFLWVTTIAYFTMYAIIGPTIEQFYPSIVFYMAVVSLVFGNFLFLYYYMVGCAKRGQWELIKYIFFIPVYWLFISIAGFMAFYQLLFKPHYWEKTVHGLHLKKDVQRIIPKVVVATEEKEEVTIFPDRFEKNFAARIFQNKQFLGGGFLIVASMVGNLGNLFFSTYFGRVLDASTLAILALVGSFWTVASILLNATGSTTNYRAGFLDGRYGKESALAFWSYIRGKSFFIALIISGLWLSATPLLLSYFQVDDIVPFITFAPIWLLGFAYFIDHGYLSGRLMFGQLGLIVLFETVVKLVIGFALFAVSPSLVYLSLPVSFTLSFLFGWLLIMLGKKGVKKSNHVSESRHFPKKFFFVSMLTGLSTMTFLTLDFILVKHYLPAEAAGQYALLSTVGKMIFFLGTLGNQFILPLVSHDEGAKKNSKKTFYLVLAATFLLASTGFVLFGIFGWYILPLPFLFGERILPVIPYLIPFGFAMLCFTVSRSFISYYLAKKMYTFPIVASAISILQFVLISLTHDTIGMVVASMVIIGGLNLVLMISMHLFESYIKIVENNITDFLGLFASEHVQQRRGLNILVFNWRDTKHVWAGGAEVYIQEIAKRWVAGGNSVTLFCGNDSQHARREEVDGVVVIRRGGFYTVYLWAILYYVFKFRGKFDVIVDCENGVPFFTPFYTRTPVVLLIHHIHQDVFRQHLLFPLSAIASFAEAKLMPMMYKNKPVVTVSDSSRKAIHKMGIAKSGDVHIVHNGIDHKEFGKLQKAAYPLFSYVGRLKAYKNIDVAIKAFAQVAQEFPNAQMVIVGYGEAYNKLKFLVDTLQLSGKVTFTGKVTDKVKAKILAMSWAMIQPSMVEGWGITVIEANASGTPVIASDVPGLRDSIVHEKTGSLIGVGDVDGFAKAMKEMVHNHARRQKLAKDAFEWAEQFDWNDSAEKFYDILVNQKKQVERVSARSIILANKGL